MDIEKITEERVDEAIDCIINIIEENQIAHTKVLKIIKEQSFNQKINNYLDKKYRNS